MQVNRSCQPTILPIPSPGHRPSRAAERSGVEPMYALRERRLGTDFAHGRCGTIAGGTCSLERASVALGSVSLILVGAIASSLAPLCVVPASLLQSGQTDEHATLERRNPMSRRMAHPGQDFISDPRWARRCRSSVDGGSFQGRHHAESATGRTFSSSLPNLALLTGRVHRMDPLRTRGALPRADHAFGGMHHLFDRSRRSTRGPLLHCDPLSIWHS